MCKRCARCGEGFEDAFEIRIINPGTTRSEKVCTTCLESMETNGEAIRCDSCGDVWSADLLHDESLDDKHTFTPCPACHKDVVDGLTREKMLDEIAPMRFAVILGFLNGRDRGYIVHAGNRGEAVEKTIKTMLERNDAFGLAFVNVSEILLKEDEIK